MFHVYESFILRRLAEGRIFVCSPKMPFEFSVCCFQDERPFFLISQFEDGRIAITPNVMYIAQNFLQAGYGSWNLLPPDFEYVMVKNGTYPLIITAHPVSDFNIWLRRFESLIATFAKQTLWDFVSSTLEFEPLFPKKKKQEYLEHEKVV